MLGKQISKTEEARFRADPSLHNCPSTDRDGEWLRAKRAEITTKYKNMTEERLPEDG